jgi:hypothetical protein
MREDQAVADLAAELRATLGRLDQGLSRLADRVAASRLVFWADEDMEREIARFMLEDGYRNQSAAIRALIREGLVSHRSRA